MTDLKIERLAELTWPTPFFVVSEQRLAANLAVFRSAFPEGRIHYALKANSEPGVLRVLAAEGAGFEIASAFELQLLQQVGVEPDRIIYGSAVKPSSHIKAAFDCGVTHFAADSSVELVKIAQAAPNSKVFIRVRVNDAGSVFRFSEKFGAELPDVETLARNALELGIEVVGLSFHVGSQSKVTDAWAKAVDHIAPLIEELRRADMPLRMLNIGGGFPCAYDGDPETSLQDIADAVHNSTRMLPDDLSLVLEPGRAIVASASVLVAGVIARIDRGARTWLFMDAGCYNGLFEAMAYQGGTVYSVSRVRVSRCSGSTFDLAGPTGDSPDVVRRGVELPADTDVGDRLVFWNSGAYTTSMSIPFNGFPKPDLYYL